MKIEKAATEKNTTRTGRKIGARDKAKISLAVNDQDRAISRILEMVKKYRGNQKERTAETYRRIVLNGLMVEIADIANEKQQQAQQEAEKQQGKLF